MGPRDSDFLSNDFLDPPDSFEVDLGPERTEDHFANGHDPRTLDLHGGDDIDEDDLLAGVDVLLDELDLDAVGLAEAQDALDRNGGEP